MSLERRLERLEARRKGPYKPDPVSRAILKDLLNSQARWRGEPEEPWTPEELPARLEAARWWLREGIPAYRAEPGWDGEGQQALLDQWEQEALAGIEGLQTELKGNNNDG